jgi:protein-S-isoprenylcysteine O-methyltransferase Ste14
MDLELQWERRLENMAKRGFLARHGIVRNAIREDLLYFALPWLLVLVAGMGLSARDLVRQQESLIVLPVQNFVGAALFVIGFTIELGAQITLRHSYSSTLVIREDHQLITHGVYRFIRHPIYLGVILVFIGIAVYASSLYGLLAFSALIPVFLNRIRMEERLLTEEFGDEYRTYKEATSKLIPFIY